MPQCLGGGRETECAVDQGTKLFAERVDRVVPVDALGAQPCGGCVEGWLGSVVEAPSAWASRAARCFQGIIKLTPGLT